MKEDVFGKEGFRGVVKGVDQEMQELKKERS